MKKIGLTYAGDNAKSIIKNKYEKVAINTPCAMLHYGDMGTE